MPTKSTSKGAQAELLAAQFLQQRGLSLLERNYHCRHGEIDLIMLDGDTLVFVEVRLRSSNSFGGAAASIDKGKQLRLVRTAQHYLASKRHTPACRFDALLFHTTEDGGIEWVRNAFGA
jgi:putative endonuclease